MQGHCTTWLRYRIADARAVNYKEGGIVIDEQRRWVEPADAGAISYALLRSLGFMLDELSAQGLRIWQDERHAWRWAWATTALQAERGFWALGEAIVDAVRRAIRQCLMASPLPNSVAYE